MTAADHILVVDDHPDIRSSLAAYLRRQGLAVSTAADAAQAGALLLKERFDLIVLDVMMPGEDGLSLCRRISGTLDTPVILLTAMHTSADKVAGLDSGADDYVVKPFDPPELVARIRTVLRRWRRPAAPAAFAVTTADGYAFNGWFLDTGKHELFDPEGQPAALSSAEYRLLRVLVEHPGTVLSRDRLMDLTGSGDALAFDRSIDSQVSRLRKKLEPDPRRPGLLKTVWGNGYLFAATVTASPATQFAVS
ncbi:response regulator [Pseudoduganella lutea]|uniref:Response regulator transcription factor n=1 Tax=Pseudoduganella lutea TaxID=321985 RepID=A0A4P6KY29_9BURK|nr:response regulator transcription factor [Pseudoduganella lutea]QBE64091.1 response regulator transcription factor [Pseudoduganella lutea]